MLALFLRKNNFCKNTKKRWNGKKKPPLKFKNNPKIIRLRLLSEGVGYFPFVDVAVMECGCDFPILHQEHQWAGTSCCGQEIVGPYVAGFYVDDVFGWKVVATCDIIQFLSRHAAIGAPGSYESHDLVALAQLFVCQRPLDDLFQSIFAITFPRCTEHPVVGNRHGKWQSDAYCH